jgi:hypothetical protein
LDAALPDRPVWLKRVDGHAGLASSTAMRLAGITASTSDPEGGRILRFADLYSRISGGNLRVAGNRPGPSGPLVGAFDLTNFDIVGEPAMSRVVSTTSSRPNEGRSGFDPENVRFHRMVVNYAKTDQAIIINDAPATRPSRRSTAVSTSPRRACRSTAPICRPTSSTTCSAACRSSGSHLAAARREA